MIDNDYINADGLIEAIKYPFYRKNDFCKCNEFPGITKGFTKSRDKTDLIVHTGNIYFSRQKAILQAMPESHITPPDQAKHASKGVWQQLLRRSDQATVACFVCIGLVGLICWMVRVQGSPDKAIELDRAAERQASFRIDMNQAEWVEWTELPDVGETIARRIVESREKEGSFSNPDDLLRVKGIGPKTLEKIRPYLLPSPGMRNVAGTNR